MFKIIFTNFHLEKILWILKSKMRGIIVFALIGAIAGGLYATYLGESVYRCEITLHVYSNPDFASDSDLNISSADLATAQTLMTSYEQVLRSNNFLTAVIENAGLSKHYTVETLQKEVTASSVSGTALFEVYVYDSNPQNAQLIANTIGEIAPTKLVNIVKSGGLEVLDQAEMPTTPYESTSVTMMALIGGVALGVLAMLLCLFKGLKDTRIRRKYEVEDMFTIPIIGTVPQEKANKDESGERLLNENSSYAVKEAYNEIRTNLSFLRKGEQCPVFAITSADKGEGKTLSSINIAKSLCKIGKRVLLIDADLRESNMGEKLALSGNGLSEYLEGNTDTVNIHYNVEVGLDVITAGIMPPNPADLVAGPKLAGLVKEKKKSYDMIIIDLPPVGRTTDALTIVDSVTAYVIIIREFISRFEREEMIVRQIERLGGDICGFIYNGISPTSEDYNFKKDSDKYGYIEKKQKKQKKTKVQMEK